MKRLVSCFLILCLMLSCTPGAVAAESASYAEYYTDSYESYLSSMNGWLWLDYLKNDNQFGFVQFSNKMEESTLLQKAIFTTIELMDGIHWNDIESPGNAEIAFYEDAILGLLVTMESELSSELDKQSEADATMTLMDYAVDGGQAAVNVAGALAGGKAAADIFMPLLNGLTGSESLIQGAMKNLESDAQYKALARSAHLYCDFEKVLSAILKSDNEALKTAAQNVLDGINQSFTYKLENISSYTGDTAIPQLGAFVFDDVLGKSIESGDITGESAAMVNLFRGVNAFNAGAGIGAFIGNSVVGGHDIFLRYFEMLAMAEIRDRLIEDISQRVSSVTGPEDYNEIREIQSYLYALLYTCQRGEYCMYSLLAKDYTGIARFIFGGKTKNVDEWYASTSNVLKTAYDRIGEFTPEIELNAVVDCITFTLYYGETGTIGATITAYDENKNVIWEYNTPEYQETELPRVSEIGQINDMYVFIQDGSIIALDVQTGNTIWENSDFGGSGTGVAVGENAIYLCGQYGPDFYAISYDGDTLKKIDSFDENYYWATEIEVSGTQAAVYLHGGNVNDYDSPQIFYVDLNTYKFATSTESNDTTGSTGIMPSLEDISVLLNKYFQNYNWNDDAILSGSACDGMLLNDTEAIFGIRVQTKSAEWTHQANVLVGTVTINREKLDGYIEWNGGSKVHIDISDLL